MVSPHLGTRCSETDSQAEDVRNMVRELTFHYGTFNVSDFIWLFRKLDFLQLFRKTIVGVHRREDALLEKILKEKEMTRRRITEGRTSHDQKTDLIDIMLDLVEKEENLEMQLTRVDIKSFIMEIFTAATDTTAIVIEWALAELINHPQVLEKARKEIEQVVGKNRLVEESDVLQLPYIQAILKETLRLHPPIPMIPRKFNEDCNASGYRIPAETVLFVNIWAIGRDPMYWEKPSEFLPERFLSETGMGQESARDFKGHDFELLPFGTGRRGCPGMLVAIQLLPITLAAMVQCFDLKVVGSDGVAFGGENMVDMTERPGFTNPRIHDLLCVPMARSVHPLGALEA